MKFTNRPFAAAVSFLLAMPLSLNALETPRGVQPATDVVAAAQTAKQQCINACRARYRDCRRLNQIPWFECRSVYQDCTRYTCTGRGPG